MQAREIRIPSRIGHFSALEWGPNDGIKVLALHGWQDNALSFQPLISYLPTNLHVIALEFCGHGHSSHLAAGYTYDTFQYITCVHETVKWLKWDKFTLIGHSLGAIIGVKFTAAFPQLVENLVTLDVAYPAVQMELFDKISIPDAVSLYLKFAAKEADPSSQPAINWEDGIEAMKKFRPNVSRSNLELLLKRNVKEVKNGLFELRRDIRMNMANWFEFRTLTADAVMKSFPNYRGSWIAIMNINLKLNDGVERISTPIEKHQIKNCKSFKIVELPIGSHYIHMEAPKLVASHIASIFLDSKTSKL